MLASAKSKVGSEVWAKISLTKGGRSRPGSSRWIASRLALLWFVLACSVSFAYSQAGEISHRPSGDPTPSINGTAQPAVLTPPQAPAQERSKSGDISAYCSRLSAGVKNSPALSKLCEFALLTRNKLPDVICDQETRRYWWAGSIHHDVITAKLSYRDGKEYRDNIRINGRPIDDAVLAMRAGSWSIGEFSAILDGIFIPTSKPQFHYEREEKLHSVSALVFSYHVAEGNNKTYYLDSEDSTWFPEYGGKLWVDKSTFELLRLERETAYEWKHPIHQVKTSIDYSNVPLGDGTKLILPIDSDVLLCAAVLGSGSDNCSRNIISFTNWHKFRATTRILTDSAE